MAGSVFDSILFADLFPCGEVSALFTDSAEVRAMMLVEAALARAQAQNDVIPAAAAAAISRAALTAQIDPASLTGPTGVNGVSVPGFVAAFRKEIAPDHAQHLHWGATSQDIIDTALMLRLRQALVHLEADLRIALDRFAALAKSHAALPMVARTYGQHATPTSFGAVVAAWGSPYLALLEDLPKLRSEGLWVSLSGAAGTAGALGPSAPAVRKEMARDLKLNDPGRTWHTDRTPILRLTDWMTRLAQAGNKVGADLTDYVASGSAVLELGGTGSSSTMPQKKNPIAPAALVAVSRHVAGLHGTLMSADGHRHQRDGAGWFLEWLTIPSVVLGAACSLTVLNKALADISPLKGDMRASIQDGLGLLHAEALSFALCAFMPRPDAQSRVKALCQKAMERHVPLPDLVSAEFPELDLNLSADAQMGQAPADANRFAESVRHALRAS